MPAAKTRKADESHEKDDMGTEELKTTAPVVPTLSAIATTLRAFTKSTTAGFLAVYYKEPFCRKPASTLGTPG